MSVLQSQPSLSISTNQCKQRFLMNEIQSMKVTKEIYHEIFDELRVLLKEMSVGGNVERVMGKDIGENKLQNQCMSEDQHHPHIPQQQQPHIQQFTNKLSQTVSSYCASSLTQNIIKYLQIQNQQHQLHPTIIRHYNTYIKSNQKTLAQRQKQLQLIQDGKYTKQQGNKQLIQNVASQYRRNYAVEKQKRQTQKTISSFDYHRRLIDIVKKEIAVLKLKRKRLILQIDQINKIKDQKQTRKEQSQNLHQLKKTNDYINAQTGKSEELNPKKLSGLKVSNLATQEPLKPKPNFKDDTSGLEKIVMVYQKQKFLNTRIQQQISQLQRKILNQRQQNKFIQEKTSQIHKQIEKLQWTKVCDSSFAPIHHKKFEKPLQLSLLDRTLLKTFDDKSIEYSQMSINQSMIKKI